jgi:hypothetical protein
MASETATDRTSCPRRRFTLVDFMILVAATAVGHAGVRGLERFLDDGDFVSRITEAWLRRHFGNLALLLEDVVLPFLMAWTVAVVPLRLLKPRPKFRHLARQPGPMAGLVVTMSIGFLGLVVAIGCVYRSWRGFGLDTVMLILGFDLLPTALGLAILAAWTTLLLGRRWRAEPSWLDRMGRMLGVAWIVLGLVSPFLVLFL